MPCVLFATPSAEGENRKTGEVKPQSEAQCAGTLTGAPGIFRQAAIRQLGAGLQPMLTLEDATLSQADLVHPMHAIPASAALPEIEAASAARDRRALRREFTKAMAGDDFSLRFLPRCLLTTQRFTAAEVVVRWKHRRRGVIPEHMLMTLADKAGIAEELSHWAFLESARVLAGLPRKICFAHTLTASQLRGPGLFDSIHMAMEECGIPPSQLELSISETTLATLDDSALMVLGSLFDEGVAIALNQFGASLGSLNLLSRMPLDYVKLDPSLVRGLSDDPSNLAMIRAVTEMAHTIGARVIAQGVETGEQREILAKLRCDEVQGGIVGPALTARELALLTV